VTDAELALLAAIRQAPHDDGPRQVYGDWLLEQGDRRGELLVLERAVARTDQPIDPWMTHERNELVRKLMQPIPFKAGTVADLQALLQRHLQPGGIFFLHIAGAVSVAGDAAALDVPELAWVRTLTITDPRGAAVLALPDLHSVARLHLEFEVGVPTAQAIAAAPARPIELTMTKGLSLDAAVVLGRSRALLRAEDVTIRNVSEANRADLRIALRKGLRTLCRMDISTYDAGSSSGGGGTPDEGRDLPY
jgi:uncharacterized protein (TIGR02996 family)